MTTDLPPDSPELRDEICRVGRSLYERGYVHATAGNISARIAGGLLITPTDACLGALQPQRLTRVGEARREAITPSRAGQRRQQRAQLVGPEAVAAGAPSERVELRLHDAVLGFAACAVALARHLHDSNSRTAFSRCSRSHCIGPISQCAWNSACSVRTATPQARATDARVSGSSRCSRICAWARCRRTRWLAPSRGASVFVAPASANAGNWCSSKIVSSISSTRASKCGRAGSGQSCALAVGRNLVAELARCNASNTDRQMQGTRCVTDRRHEVSDSGALEPGARNAGHLGGSSARGPTLTPVLARAPLDAGSCYCQQLSAFEGGTTLVQGPQPMLTGLCGQHDVKAVSKGTALASKD